MDLPAVSIITPCLNAAETIEHTLASVREQDHPRVEHIVVDGGSTDGTVELLERAEGVRYVSEPDNGLSDAVNKGVRMATGEVIGWLNADDVYRPGALRAVAEAFAAKPGALWGFGRCAIMGAEGEEIRSAVTAYKDFFLRRWSFPLHLVQNFVSAPATFVRRRAFDEFGLFDERFKYSMDYDFWLRLGAAGHEPLFVDREVAAFRMAGESLSMTGFETQFREHAENAREHGAGHPIAVGANVLMSRLIPVVYRGMKRVRER